MARERYAALWALWRARMERSELGGETAAAFCGREGVSTAYRVVVRLAATTEGKSVQLSRAVVLTSVLQEIGGIVDDEYSTANTFRSRTHESTANVNRKAFESAADHLFLGDAELVPMFGRW